jgi:hypothetical protein
VFTGIRFCGDRPEAAPIAEIKAVEIKAVEIID